MAKIEKWSLEQFKRVMSSPIRLSEFLWDQDHLLDALSYAKRITDSELERDMRALIGCQLQKVPRPRGSSWGFHMLSAQARVSSKANHTANALTQLYRKNNLKTLDSALFGFVFCSVLSEGHESPIWANLALDNRMKLLAAQVYLTPLPPSHFRLAWVDNPSKISSDVKEEARPTCFATCVTHFTETIFPMGFDASYITDLRAATPLTGISALRTLPKRRRDIAQAFKQGSWECQKDCGKRILYALDQKIDSVFSVLSDSYHDKVR
jgi:hypothetical protein